MIAVMPGSEKIIETVIEYGFAAIVTIFVIKWVLEEIKDAFFKKKKK